MGAAGAVREPLAMSAITWCCGGDPPAPSAAGEGLRLGVRAVLGLVAPTTAGAETVLGAGRWVARFKQRPHNDRRYPITDIIDNCS